MWVMLAGCSIKLSVPPSDTARIITFVAWSGDDSLILTKINLLIVDVFNLVVYPYPEMLQLIIASLDICADNFNFLKIH